MRAQDQAPETPGARAVMAMRYLEQIGGTEVIVQAVDGGFDMSFSYDGMRCRTTIGQEDELGLNVVREAIRRAEFN